MEPIRFRCRSCNQSLRVAADRAGLKVRCNRCRAVVIVPTPEEPGATTDDVASASVARSRAHEPETLPADEEMDEEEREEQRPKKRRKRRHGEAWRLVRLGLLILLLGTVVQVVFSTLSYFPVGPSAGSARAVVRWLNVVLWTSIVISSVCTLAQLTGFGLCLFAPQESGARPFTLTALVCTLITGVLLNVVFWVTFRLPDLPFAADSPEDIAREARKRADQMVERMKQAEKDGAANPEKMAERMKQLQREILDEQRELTRQALGDLPGQLRLQSLWQTAVTLVHSIFIIAAPLMLRAFCRAAGRQDLEPSCDNLLKVGAGVIALGLASRLFLMLLLTRLGALLTVLMFVSLVVGLAWQVMYLVLLLQVRQALPRR